MIELIATQKYLEQPGTAVRALEIGELPRPTWAEIDLSASEYNIRRIREIVGPQVKVLAMVKAEAYGHGMAGIARAAERAGASMLGVATLSEALALDEASALPKLVVGWTPGWQAGLAIKNDISCAIADLETAGEFARTAQALGKLAHVHVKVDTGMGRLGFLPEEAAQAIATIAALSGMVLDGVYSHFSKADEFDPAYTYQQFDQFKHVLDEVAAAGIEIPIRHVSNSPSILRFPEMHLDLVRPGIILHGLDPSDDVPCPSDFKSVMTLKTLVASVKTLPPGSQVSYGGTYITPGHERIAVIPIGYADGFRRKPHNWGEVLVRGQRAPIVGRVCMDQCLINVTHIPEVKMGDEVVLIGEQGDDRIRAEEVAAKLGTNNYETVSLIMARVPRIYLE
ncbi:alanine racemase [Thermoflexales bacterium]|nr:alanine racemase [Thermoflexales bacterium]